MEVVHFVRPNKKQLSLRRSCALLLKLAFHPIILFCFFFLSFLLTSSPDFFFFFFNF